MDDLARLTTIEELRVLKSKYWRYVDTKQWDSFATLFVEDATFTDHSEFWHCADRAAIMTGIPAALDGVVTVHHGHQSEFTFDSDQTATGIWAMEDYLIFPSDLGEPGKPAVLSKRGYGHYAEKYVRVDGRWLFQDIQLYRLRLEVVTTLRTEIPDALKV